MLRPNLLCSALLTLAATDLLAACGGPSSGEFVEACLQGQMGGEHLSRAQCECAAGEAKSEMSADGYKLMVFDMQNNRDAVEKIKASMSDEDEMELLRATVEIVGKCFVD